MRLKPWVIVQALCALIATQKQDFLKVLLARVISVEHEGVLEHLGHFCSQQLQILCSGVLNSHLDRETVNDPGPQEMS